jgi:hypothetical protein
MKKIILGLMVVFSYTIKAQVPNYVPTSGLAGWWSFTGNANDGSGNGNNGTVNGATLTTDRFGNTNCAYSFNGSSNYIRIPHNSGLNFTNSQFSISFWLSVPSIPNPSGNSMALFSKINQNLGIDASGSSALGWDINFNQNSHDLSCRIKNGNSSAWGALSTSNYNFNINNWYHAVFIVDKLNDSIKLFLNGNQYSSISLPLTSSIGANAFDLLIGKGYWISNGIPSNFFSGKLDDIGIWNRGLTQQEVTTLYSGSGCTYYDTVTTQVTVYDTTYVTIYDTVTTTQTVYDTVTTYLSVNDTLKINVSLTGINPPQNINTLSVYPNPAKDHIFIDNGNLASMSGYTIKITNTLGQVVFNQPVTQQSFYIDLSTWGGNGTYFLYVIDPNLTVKEVKKIVLQ